MQTSTIEWSNNYFGLTGSNKDKAFIADANNFENIKLQDAEKITGINL